jgi:hypothetical protein
MLRPCGVARSTGGGAGLAKRGLNKRLNKRGKNERGVKSEA